MSQVRDRILTRVREAIRDREAERHPGPVPGASEPPLAQGGGGRLYPVDAFADRFSVAGGEVVRFTSRKELVEWLEVFSRDFESACIGEGVPDELTPRLPAAAPDSAGLGVSVAVAGAAQTGSLILSSREGRASQLLAPTHLIWLDAERMRRTLGDALNITGSDLPAVLALHSGPSKSADIGQVMVMGVHGPGRIIAGILEFPRGG